MPETEPMHIQARDLIALINEKCQPTDRICIGIAGPEDLSEIDAEANMEPIEKLVRRSDGHGWFIPLPLPEQYRSILDGNEDMKTQLAKLLNGIDDLRGEIDEHETTIAELREELVTA